jgi:hypothetical protein
MKLVKKWMIVPFEEKKLPTIKEKIEKILNNKGLNKETKIKLINNIRKSHVSKESQNDNAIPEETGQDNQNNSNRAGPAENEPVDDETKHFENEISEINDVDDESRFFDVNTTFKHAYDYLNPSEQTRSKSQEDRSFLNLEKQKDYEKKRKLGEEANKILFAEPNKRIKLVAKRRLEDNPSQSINPPQTILNKTPKNRKPKLKKTKKSKQKPPPKTPVSIISNQFSNLSVDPPKFAWDKYKSRTRRIFNLNNGDNK